MNDWTLTIKRLPCSMNQRERQSFWVRKKELDEITLEVSMLARQAKIPVAQGRRFVQITIHKSKRSRVLDDPANLPSRAKAILDALVRCGLLIDDNHAGLHWGGVIEGEKRDAAQTVVRIAEAAA